MLRIEEEKSPAPGGNQTHNLKSFAPLSCALALCNNHCPGVWASTAMTARGFEPMTPWFGELPLPQCYPSLSWSCICARRLRCNNPANTKIQKGKIFTFHQNLTNLFGEHIFGNCLKLIDKNLFFSFQQEKIFKFVS